MKQIKCKIISDTREQNNGHILEQFRRNNIDYEEKSLIVGDYKIESDTGYTPHVVIERKSSLSEILSNIIDKNKDTNGHNRFFRELERAKKSNTKVIIAIEDSNFYEHLIKGEYKNNINVNAAKGLLISLQAKYPNINIVGVDAKYIGSYIFHMLYYALREDLKEKTLNN